MIISYGWTRDRLPDKGGCKEETRRGGVANYLKTWQKQFDDNPLKWHEAYDKSPLYGGVQIGSIQLKERPYLQPLHEMDSAAVAREGHPDWTPAKFLTHYFWKPKKKWTPEQAIAEWTNLLNTEVAVIRFEYRSMQVFDPTPKQLVFI